MTHLVTGYAGYEHIQSSDAGAFNAAFFGNGQYVMEVGNQFEGSIIDNNTVRILDGDGLMYGRHFRMEPDTYEDVTIKTGTAGTNRIDLIVMTYSKDENDGTETAYLQVIKGEETEGTAMAPEYTDGNILDGAVINQMPLYKVTISGVVLQKITPMFATLPTYQALAKKYEAEFKTACDEHLGALNILDTMEELEANTQGNQLAGALAVKEGFASLNDTLTNNNGEQFYFDYQDGKYGFNTDPNRGADTFNPFGNPHLRYDEESGYIQAMDENGNWVNIFATSQLPLIPFLVIFNNGTEYFTRTTTKGSVSMVSDNYLKMTAASDGQIAVGYLVDVTGYTKLKATIVSVTNINTNYIALGLSTSVKYDHTRSHYEAYATFGNSTSKQEIEVDISNCEGEYYVSCQSGSTSNSTLAVIQIEEIQLTN